MYTDMMYPKGGSYTTKHAAMYVSSWIFESLFQNEDDSFNLSIPSINIITAILSQHETLKVLNVLSCTQLLVFASNQSVFFFCVTLFTIHLIQKCLNVTLNRWCSIPFIKTQKHFYKIVLIQKGKNLVVD